MELFQAARFFLGLEHFLDVAEGFEREVGGNNAVRLQGVVREFAVELEARLAEGGAAEADGFGRGAGGRRVEPPLRVHVLPHGRRGLDETGVRAVVGRDEVQAGVGGDDVEEVVARALEDEGGGQARPRRLDAGEVVVVEEEAKLEHGLEADLERGGGQVLVEGGLAGGGEIALDAVADDGGEDEAEDAGIGAGGFDADVSEIAERSVGEEAERGLLETDDADFLEIGSAGGLNRPALRFGKFVENSE